jgi:hypothetical protein
MRERAHKHCSVDDTHGQQQGEFNGAINNQRASTHVSKTGVHRKGRTCTPWGLLMDQGAMVVAPFSCTCTMLRITAGSELSSQESNMRKMGVCA